MEIQKVELKNIYPYFNNPRDNSSAVEPVMESIRKYGFVKPIMVDKNMVIICGHTRYIAAFQLGCEYVPIIVSDMPEEQAKRFRIIDNKIAEKSSFDENELIEELKKLEVPSEMQPFFFESIDTMLNFSLDQFNQQVEESGGFVESPQDFQSEDYQTEDSSSEEWEDEGSEKRLFVALRREDGSQYMNVVCPYCGNVEEIELD